MFSYKILDKTSAEEIHKTFIDAFSDYQVKMDLPLLKFKQMLKRRGYVPDISIGAFENDRLVGFVLNGLRSWNENRTAYDIGTGVVGEYRRQGITSNMLMSAKEVFKEKQVDQYLLEVIKSNTSAVQLYKKQGFEIQREFMCFQLDKDKYSPTKNYRVEHVDRIEWSQLIEFWDFKPSWQNSVDSIDAISESFIYSIVRFDKDIVGYGIIDKKTGDIAQIAVSKRHRRKGIARSIITDMIENTESHKISILNVDNKFESTKDFLSKIGFKHSVSQYEMILKL
ncbi:acetyltransferase, GNAT family [Gottschalkia acidurici 9a]|uniref:Acetyltransferase, GNAT family n=1 Tax=Gottschalkia acidurici (strain ATCC 7906 / DSM 604 / BCRC 14475 / CIP 104303 / KCTC 5404 / NCIMB 10678 / 9a) TaxID=1128398 RepID=K0AUN0_GOTA9|nr:GNAT family N-acetyltransferase [Gottschalkia acidurici]AFS77588.1 acetyltransferase, GNAT family [Gottschalkia acidurici 9a]